MRLEWWISGALVAVRLQGLPKGSIMVTLGDGNETGAMGRNPGLRGVIELWLTGPRLALLVGSYATVILSLDAQVGSRARLLLAVATWVFLALALMPRSDIWRARTVAVVVVATAGELLGSQVLGLYEYRAGSVPGYVPPGHGLVFLAGCGLADARIVRKHADHFVVATCALALVWATAAATSVASPDLSGAVGAVAFVAIVLAAPRNLRPYYAGVFIAVSLLEVVGTALGAWRWAETSPLLALPAGNPPSGAASGYCLFDVAGFALAPWLAARAGAWSVPRWIAGLRSQESSMLRHERRSMASKRDHMAGDHACRADERAWGGFARNP